jgi:uncharacterized membrane protein
MLRDPLTMNDWELRRTLLVTVVLQIVFLGSAGLNAIGMPLLIVQQVTGCIFLLFIPGVLLLRVLRLHNLGPVATPLYAVGLSIATLMFSGLLINQAYPYFGITRPIATLPLLITLSAAVDILCLAAFVRDRTFSGADSRELRAVSPAILALCLIPFVSIFGTYVMNGTQNNAVLLILIVLIAATVVVLTFRRDVPRHLYPLAVFVSALSLVYYESLISNYLVGWDIQRECYLAGLVVASGSWNPSLSITWFNSALSVVLLGPILSLTCGMSIVSVFKVVYPLIFALVPVALYLVFRKQTNEKVAFLSAFLFVAVEQFFVETTALARQEIAELFLVLIVLEIVTKQNRNRGPLLVLFAFALIVSHYGLAYVFIFLLIVAVLGLALLDNQTIRRIWGRGRSQSAAKDPVARGEGSARDGTRQRSITWAFVALFIVASQLWYIYTAGGLVFYNAVTALNYIASGTANILTPSATGAGVVTSTTTSPLHTVEKYLYFIIQFLIVVGVVAFLAKKTRIRLDKEYAALAVGSFVLLLAVFAVPGVAAQLNTSRFFQLALIFLAPFAALGGLAIIRASSSAMRVPYKANYEKSFLKAFSIFLAIFLMFTTGFVYAIAEKSDSTAIPLNAAFDAPRFNNMEVAGAAWLSNEKTNATPVYADVYRGLLLDDFFFPTVNIFPANNSLPAGALVYLGSLNVQQGKLVSTTLASGEGTTTTSYTNASIFTSGRSRVYDNGGAQVYY